MASKKGSEGSGIIWCHDSGSDCLTFVEDETKPELLPMFARARHDSPVYDGALDELSRRLTDMAAAAHAQRTRRDVAGADTQIGILKTGAGFLLVWKRDVSSTERLEDLVDVDSLTDLDAMSDAERDSYLGLRESDGGEWRRGLAARDSGLYHCRSAGENCFVSVEMVRADAGAVEPTTTLTYFPTVDEGSPVYDRDLRELASRLNAAINEVQANGAADRPGQHIGLTITDRGLLPVWKNAPFDDDEVGDRTDLVDLEAMTAAQRQAFLQLE
jgi:hypothetical protein